jgi:IS5 family transposase
VSHTTFPTDAKLAKRIIDKCNAIAQKLGLVQRQTYRRVSKQLVRDTYNAKHPKRRKKALKAMRKLKTLAGRQLRELRTKLGKSVNELLEKELSLYERVLAQTRAAGNKIYSLHKPFTACIAKGKANKQYEFGNKVGLIINSKTLVVTAIDTFEGNPHDSKTIKPLLEQMQNLQGYLPEEIVYDRGGKGQTQIMGVKISTPSKPLKRDNSYQKQKKRRKFRRRAAIEPVISHLKTDHRMAQNYLHGEKSPKMNAMLAAAGWNFKKMMQKLKEKLLQSFLYWYYLRSIANNLAS